MGREGTPRTWWGPAAGLQSRSTAPVSASEDGSIWADMSHATICTRSEAHVYPEACRALDGSRSSVEVCTKRERRALGGSGGRAVVERDGAEEGAGGNAALRQGQLFARLPQPARVPPQHATVAGRRHRLRACFGLQPCEIVHRVPTRAHRSL
jgi:hypothetical protein